MPITYTTYARFAKPPDFMGGWGTVYNANADLLDGMAPTRSFACTLPVTPGNLPIVRVRGGKFRWVEFLSGEQFGDESNISLTPYTTSDIYAIWESIRARDVYPTGQSYIPIARVTTDDKLAAVIDDQRCPYLMTGFSHLIASDFANDTAAAVGGIQVGELYHTSGTVQIRRS
jgi:hypothetical protein